MRRMRKKRVLERFNDFLERFRSWKFRKLSRVPGSPLAAVCRFFVGASLQLSNVPPLKGAAGGPLWEEAQL